MQLDPGPGPLTVQACSPEYIHYFPNTQAA